MTTENEGQKPALSMPETPSRILEITPAKLSPGLYIVATPIGNLKDITLRALEILHAADVIAAEDTRVTAKLCNHYNITTTRISYHEYSSPKEISTLIEQLKAGKSIALVSDAGTPLISDPGSILIKACQTDDIPVIPIPGPSTVTAAKSVAGFEDTEFYFAGFLPQKQKKRREKLNELSALSVPVIFFEAPHRLQDFLEDMQNVWGEVELLCARELTKTYETILQASIQTIIDHFQHNTPRGEFVIIAKRCNNITIIDLDSDEFIKKAKACLEEYSLKDASKILSIACERPKSEIYAKLLNLKEDGKA